MNIRAVGKEDSEAIKQLYLRAFPEEEGEIVSALAINLIFEETTPGTLSLAAVVDQNLAGHIAFSPVRLGKEDHLQGFILAPLAVEPDSQKKGVGTQLVEYGLQVLSNQNVEIVFVYGDPDYYGRFGFTSKEAERYTTPYPLEHKFGWQAAILKNFQIAPQVVAIKCVDSLNDPALW